jgi:hypothetical protein
MIPNIHNKQRRQFLKKTTLGGSIIAFGGGYFWLNSGVGTEQLTIESAIQQLDSLKEKKITSTGKWNPAQIFNHLAQSIEYSMTGYPQQNSDLFKNTLGSVAFSVFSKRGQMMHGLSELIPGAPLIKTEEDSLLALKRLKQSLIDFNNYSGDLKPHFAYGELSKQEYSFAHIMHINNHFQELGFEA